MKSLKINIIPIIAAWGLVLIVGASCFSKIYFKHAHVLENGKIIYHTHPYEKNSDSSPYKHHHHSNYQLTSIDHSNLFFETLSNTFQIILPGIHVDFVINKSMCVDTSFRNMQGRAPPILYYS